MENQSIENVADVVAALCLEIHSTQISSRTDDSADLWDKSAYHFHVVLTCAGRSMALEYSQGPGHTDRRISIDHGEYRVPRKPRLADVVDSLRSDAIGCDQSFEDWCADLGYDSDSRRAERTYHACVRTRVRLAQLLGREGFARLMRAEGL